MFCSYLQRLAFYEAAGENRLVHRFCPIFAMPHGLQMVVKANIILTVCLGVSMVMFIYYGCADTSCCV